MSKKYTYIAQGSIHGEVPSVEVGEAEKGPVITPVTIDEPRIDTEEIFDKAFGATAEADAEDDVHAEEEGSDEHVEEDGAKTHAAPTRGDGKAAVSQTIDEIAADLHRTVGGEPRVLTVALARTTRRIVPVMRKAPLYVVTAMTGDRRFDASPKLANETVKLGDIHSRALLANAYAVLSAADESDVAAVFLCDDASALAEDERFLELAAGLKLRVFTPVGPTRSRSAGRNARRRPRRTSRTSSGRNAAPASSPSSTARSSRRGTPAPRAARSRA